MTKIKRVKFKRYTWDQVEAHAKSHPITSDYAFGEHSGGYSIPTSPSRTAHPLSVSCKKQEKKVDRPK